MSYLIEPSEEWVRETVTAACAGSSGGCGNCGHVDGQDAFGTFMLDFWTPEEGGEVLCPSCYESARSAGSDGTTTTGRRK